MFTWMILSLFLLRFLLTNLFTSLSVKIADEGENLSSLLLIFRPNTYHKGTQNNMKEKGIKELLCRLNYRFSLKIILYNDFRPPVSHTCT